MRTAAASIYSTASSAASEAEGAASFPLPDSAPPSRPASPGPVANHDDVVAGADDTSSTASTVSSDLGDVSARLAAMISDAYADAANDPSDGEDESEPAQVALPSTGPTTRSPSPEPVDLIDNPAHDARVDSGRTDGLAITRSFQRNPKVAAYRADLAGRSQRGGASSTFFVPQAGVAYDSFAFNYHTGLPKKMNLKDTPADGVVRGTIVINVSGHDGAAAAANYAKENEYNLSVRLPSGKTLSWNRAPRNEPSTTEYATVLDIEFPFEPGVTTIEGSPDRSAGIWGYVEGRRYEAHSPDQPFDVNQANADAAAYRTANSANQGYTHRFPVNDF